MPTYIALLRAVNVGGTNKLPMADFRRMLAGLGYRRVETYIQSGNAVFDADAPIASVTKSVADGLARLVGRPVELILWSHDALTRAIAANPFATEAAADGARVHAMFLSAVPAAGADEGLKRIPARNDRYHLAGDVLYLHLPDGAGESKFTVKTLDRILGVTSTARNWNTVLKLHEMSKR
jgi:uncharacterized protein (DUF1697 family)